jgi:hypothetical protein
MFMLKDILPRYWARGVVKNTLKQDAPVEDVNEVDGANGGPKAVEMRCDCILARCEGPS